MSDLFVLGVAVGAIVGPVLIVLLFLFFAVWTSRSNRQESSDPIDPIGKHESGRLYRETPVITHIGGKS